MDEGQVRVLDTARANRADAYLDVADVIMVALDRYGRVTLVNRKGREILGYRDDELVGRDWFDTCIPASSRDAVRAVFGRIMAGELEPVEYFENPVVTKSGEERLIAWRNALLRDEAGAMEGTLSSGSDITERHAMIESLRAGEARYRSLVEHMGEGVVQVDNDDLILFVNDRLCRMLGKARDELLGTIGYEVFSVDERGRQLIREKNRLRLAGVADSYETTMSRSNGEVIRVSISGAPLFGPHGDVVGSVGLITDITERTQAEEALRRSEAFHQAVIENSPIGISVRDRTGRLLSANEAWKRIWAIPESDIEQDAARPRQALEFNHRDDYLRPYQEELRRVYEHGGHLRIPELRIHQHRPGSAQWVSQHFYAIQGSDGLVDRVVILTEDITERTRAEQERDELQEQLHQARKLESVGRLAGGVAHDFNNQLQVVLGHTEMAFAKAALDHPIREDLEEIRKAAERSSDLTRQLLAFARKQLVSPRVMNLNEAVDGMLTMLGRLIGEGIALVWRPSPGLWCIRIDPTQIVQILANLCANARDAIDDVGTVTIETSNVSVDEAYCTDHAGFIPGEYVVLSVTDDGCGMDEEAVSHIFEPFFTTKELGRGVGLGLATVYGIVKQNEGFIHVYSEPRQGTTFKIYLRREDIPVSDAPPQKVSDEPLSGQGETVLIVEDDASLLSMTAQMLEALGYSVVTSGTPEEALRVAAGHEGPIDLLITDVVMPQMHGRALSARIAELRPGVRCLFMSGYTANVIAHRGVLADGVHFLQKPFTMRGLSLAVRQALGAVTGVTNAQ